MTASPSLDTLMREAKAGAELRKALRAYETAVEGRVLPEPIKQARAAYDAAVNPPPVPRLTVELPSTYVARNVRLRIGKDGSRWIVEAEDGATQLHDVRFDGFTGRVRFATKRAAEEMLERHGHGVGALIWATPAPAVRS